MEKQETWYEYDKEGRLTRTYDTNSYSEEIKYLDDGKEIISINDKGFIICQRYNKDDNLLYKRIGDYEYWFEYDDHGNEILATDTNCNERIQEYTYDEQGRIIHFKDNQGYEEWNTYDENGNMIHFKDNHGFEEWNTYDENNNKIYHKEIEKDKFNLGEISITETDIDYDSQGRFINKTTKINNSTITKKRTYNRDGSYTEREENDDFGLYYIKEFDKDNNLLYENNIGYEIFRDYDNQGNEIRYENTNGLIISSDYDENGNMIHCLDHDNGNIVESYYEYDKHDNMVYSKRTLGRSNENNSITIYEQWNTYDENGNIIYRKSISVE